MHILLSLPICSIQIFNKKLQERKIPGLGLFKQSPPHLMHM